MAAYVTPFKRGDLIRRLIVGPPTGLTHTRLFRVSMVSAKNGVFTALSADGEWMDWGGRFPKPHEFEIVKETK